MPDRPQPDRPQPDQPQPDQPQHHTLTAAALIGAGLLFTIYPALRPYTDETTLAGAAAFASPAWVAAHTAGIFGFVLLIYGLSRIAQAQGGRVAATASLLTWLGGTLVLPYYGAEAFGLQVIGARAAADGDASLLELANKFRYAPLPLTMFGTGLSLLAIAGVLWARACWSPSTRLRIAGLLIAIGLIGYLPQFFAPPGVRIAHGVALGLGCILLALTQRRRPAQRQAGAPKRTSGIKTASRVGAS